MDFLSNINFVLIAQLTVLAMVVISGPVIVFLLSLRGGDL
ncbi:MAG: photosystem II reaction center protein Ycf12 [Cyanobacteria bacterium J06554_6]